jgi:hypothetical protein
MYKVTNKEKVREYMNKQNVCICGGLYTCVNKSQHFRSTRHIRYIQSLSDITDYAYCYTYYCEDGIPCTEQEFINYKMYIGY